MVKLRGKDGQDAINVEEEEVIAEEVVDGEEEEEEEEGRFVALDKEPAVLDPMLAVLQRLQSAQNTATVNVPPTDLGEQSVDQALVTSLIPGLNINKEEEVGDVVMVVVVGEVETTLVVEESMNHKNNFARLVNNYIFTATLEERLLQLECQPLQM